MIIRRIKPISCLRMALVVLIVFFAIIQEGFSAPLVEFSNNKLTVRAENESLVRLLEQVAKKTNVVIFVSKEFKPGSVNIRFENLPLEKAFKKLLNQHDFVTIYNKKDDSFTISALKVYPKGKSSGEMDVLITRSETTDETQSDNTGISPTIHGVTEPGQYVAYAAKKDKSLIQIAHGFEQTEKKASSRINELRQKISQTENEAEKKQMTLDLVQRVVAFEEMQTKHGNAIESLYRASLFQKNSRNPDD